MSRVVVIQRQAFAALGRISRSIGMTVSPIAGMRWLALARANINALATNADQWPEADEAQELNIELKCRLFGRRRHVYRILYTIEENEVLVHFVRHATQDKLTEED